MSAADDYFKKAEVAAKKQNYEYAIELRNPYIDPMNAIQVALLRRLREGPKAEAEEIRDIISVTIHGIAAGLKNTG